MAYRFLAEVIVIIHLAFVVFVLLGGFLVLKSKRAAWLHLPAVLWAAAVEFTGWVCPLTPLENWLRQQAGGAAYHSGFVAHYLLPCLYPTFLTRHLQILLGCLVLALNLVIYGWVTKKAA
ncbi:MAG: DUF2784 domain-containing protein [Deltaproteobacteria bacterium]|nr:DUF2784 domain-containing protein [Deltaproteobacteria bacterium]MBW1953268.1 DUF2784 domain-containing protein [Deltaproteobacteria bacterium]MBW1986407.1 DUF2784 domain-containing protein [Deltaproteobacteria bacterium]